MMEVKDIIKSRRIEMGLTMKELADRVGVSEGTISRWESGHISNMRRDKVSAMSKIMGIPPEVIMGWETDVDRFKVFADAFNLANFSEIKPATTKRYPILGKVACGKPILANAEQEVLVGETEIKADAVIIAKGDSMIGARIYDGDIVFIKFQETAENGQIVAVAIENEHTGDYEVTLKRFHRYGEDLVILKPENPNYDDIILQKEGINRLHIIGKAVAFQSDLN